MFRCVIKTATFITAACSVIACASAFAQRDPVSDPRRPQDYRAPQNPSAEDKCVIEHDPESVYDPHSPVTKTNVNHSTLQNAICHAKPGREVIVYRDHTKLFMQPFTVTKPNLTIRAFDSAVGGTVAVKQGAGECIVINPRGGGRFEDITTTLDGFTFVTSPEAKSPCVKIVRGKLILKNSRIIVNGETVAVDVSPTASFDFAGSDYDEHGIFAEPDSEGNSQGTGVLARRSGSIALSNVRIDRLQYGVSSQAKENLFHDAIFTNNTIAVDIKDSAVVSAYSPNVDITGGRYSQNGAAILLTAGKFDAFMPEISEYARTRPFRGHIKIAKSEYGPVEFLDNDEAVTLRAAYPKNTMTIDGVNFSRNSAHALRLSMPNEEAVVNIHSASFISNTKAISVDGLLNGRIEINGPSRFGGGGGQKGIELRGNGSFSAALASVGGLRPAFEITSGWRGKLGISVASDKTPPEFIRFTPDTPFCKQVLNSRKARESFKRRVGALSIMAGGRHFAYLHNGRDIAGMSNRQLENFQYALCASVD